MTETWEKLQKMKRVSFGEKGGSVEAFKDRKSREGKSYRKEKLVKASCRKGGEIFTVVSRR